MCGIAGYLGRGDEHQLRALAGAIAHRGPDGEGYWTDLAAGVGLAHRRLAIIDPTNSAAQPMASCEGRYQVVFNGEIYNFRALAVELAALGYRFNRNSDTAVLGPLYDRYGVDCVHKLNGMFAFALWDTATRQLFIARDAFGVKPLYFARRRGGLVFASELKSLLRVAGWDRTLDERAMMDYLVHLWSPGRRTPFKAIQKLLPGHYLLADTDRLALKEWYAPPIGASATGDGGLNVDGAIDQVRHVFDCAVSDQCISDVPIGAFLSGGVDSSAIVAAMVASGHTPARAYCIGFDGPLMEQEGFGDDLRYARMMAQRFSVPLSEIRVGEPSPAELRALPIMLDEPQADPAALYVAAIAATARADGIKVLLAGTGGDDIFSGYRRHRAAVLRMRLGALSNVFRFAWLTGRFGPRVSRRRLAKLGYLFEGTDEQFLLRAFEFNRRSDVLACLSRDLVERLAPDEAGHLDVALAVSAGYPLIERMLHLELHGFLPDHNLNYTDKAGMRHGVEVRVPFLDTRLVELAGSVPWQFKTRGLAEKWIFKRAMANQLPAAILRRKKTGFGAPIRAWLSRGSLRTLAYDVLASKRFRERGLFNIQAVQTLLHNTAAGTQDGAYLIFSILMIEFWLESFVDSVADESAALASAL